MKEKKQSNIIPFPSGKENSQEQSTKDYVQFIVDLSKVVSSASQTYKIDLKSVLSDLTYIVVSEDILKSDFNPRA